MRCLPQCPPSLIQTAPKPHFKTHHTLRTPIWYSKVVSVPNKAPSNENYWWNGGIVP